MIADRASRVGKGVPVVRGKGESHDWGEDVWELDGVLGRLRWCDLGSVGAIGARVTL